MLLIVTNIANGIVQRAIDHFDARPFVALGGPAGHGQEFACAGRAVLAVGFAIRDIWRSPSISETNQLLWTLLILFAPVVGTIVYFVVSRPDRAARAAARAPSDRG